MAEQQEGEGGDEVVDADFEVLDAEEEDES
jgi:hypothetical protein